jgi:hypothetical protein
MATKVLHSDKRILIFAAAFAVLGVASLASSYAARRDNPTAGSGSIQLVLLDPTKSEPRFKDQLTYSVSSDQKASWVDTECNQGEIPVYTETRGFFDEYPLGQTFTLGPSSTWTSGGAVCTAELYTLTDDNRRISLATTSFSVLD